MGFWDEAENAVIFRGMAPPSGHDLMGVPTSPSQKPLGDICDLRHPNPIRPVFSNQTIDPRVLLPARVEVREEHRTDRRVLAAPLSRATAQDQRTVAEEDRTDG